MTDISLADLKTAIQKAPSSKVSAPEKAKPEAKRDSLGRAYATGKRKNAIAKVWIKPGNGKIIVNKKNFTEYFGRSVLRMIVNQPMVTVNRAGQFDIIATVIGGGLSGQAGAIKHGISKALDIYEPELHSTLRKEGLLTRDSRVVERKKYGQAKARKRFQFSKR